jgi:hypothetical protein
MAERDTFVSVSDGDQLNQGYFNQILTEQGTVGTNGSIGVPIGTILPWAKSFTGVPALPAGFLECDGSAISDASSPMDGETLPDLNGNNSFVRGNSTSGGTGGSDSIAVRNDLQDGGSVQANNDGTAGANLPPFYDIVWIMRIK